LSTERDLRKYSNATQKRLVVGVILLIFIFGDGLVFLIYGKEAGRMALICTGLGLVPAILIVGLLWFFGWLMEYLNKN